MGKKGVILLNMGGPERLEAVEPFLFNLFTDREIIRLGPLFLQRPLAWIISKTRTGKTKANYNLIGGGSPILKISGRQSEELEKLLEKNGHSINTYVGMRYWHPTIENALQQALADGVDELLALPMFPQYSKATTGSCFNEMQNVLKKVKLKIKVRYVENWHQNPMYIEALNGTVREGFSKIPENIRTRTNVLFSAHSLPKSFVDEGDPYVGQVEETVDAVKTSLVLTQTHLAFQSRSGPVKWIEPDTKEAIKELAKKGVKSILMVPISFVSDHLETLYEMDILYKDLAEELGMSFYRAPALNTNQKFVEALADIVLANWKD